MKVLLCHTYYLQRGGEDCCFEEERDILRAHGHDVVEFVRNNEQLLTMNPLRAAATTLWNRRAVREFRQILERARPDVVHCTNTFPLISPAVCHAAHRAGTAVVQALHNYRWLCAGAYFMRDGSACEDCLGKQVPWPAVLHRCYRNSVGASAAVVGMQMVHRTFGNWMTKVDAFFTLTEFARQRFVAGGFPAEKIHVKANSVLGNPAVGAGEGEYVVFVGRLSPEKGIAVLLQAWREDAALPRLVIVGDGPLAEQVKADAAADERIEWRGRLPLDETLATIGRAKALVMPSLWYETFGRTIAEAFAAGTPVIVSRLGAMQELVDDARTGFHFIAGDSHDLATAIHRLYQLPADEYSAMRLWARQQFEDRYTAERNYERLIEIYGLARAEADRRLRPRRTGAVQDIGGNPLKTQQPVPQRLLV
jgi:glycosyltransferase involved in cell wall biosynthesis